MGPLSLRASCTHTRVRCTRFHLEAEWPTGRQLENRVASALQQHARRDPEARETLAASRLTQSPSVLNSNERLDARSAFESSQVLRTGSVARARALMTRMLQAPNEVIPRAGAERGLLGPAAHITLPSRRSRARPRTISDPRS